MVEGLPFQTSLVDPELPIDPALFVVAGDVPGGWFLAEGFEVSDPATRAALAGHRTRFVLGTVFIQPPCLVVLGDVQPTAVFGGHETPADERVSGLGPPETLRRTHP